ncbi:MAG: SHOCT domain-containing protein [Stellaceae bacterium]
MRHIVGFSTADEIEKLERLRTAGTISNDEFTRLRAKIVQ